MKTQKIRSALVALLNNPTVKKSLGQIGLQIAFRLLKPASPFFGPMVKLGAVGAVVSALLVLLRDQIFPILGVPVPDLAVLAIEIIGWVSATIASMSALTLNDEGVAQLKNFLEADE